MAYSPLDPVRDFYDFFANHDRVNQSNESSRLNQEYTMGLYNDNLAYWDRYRKKHHIEDREIMYPYRSGYNFNLAPYYSAEASIKSNEKSEIDALFKILRSFTRSLESLYGDE